MADEDEKVSIDLEFERWSLEIRRGALSLAIIAAILDGQSYGYNIMKKLNAEEYDTLQIDPSTTYPLLRRLEKRGILEGTWSVASGNRRRLYYVTTEGRLIFRQMVASWRKLNDQLMRLVEEASQG